MKNRPILFFDSGIGGLPYLTHLKKVLPNEKFIYIADSKNFPYGEKSESELLKVITETVIRVIEKFRPKVVIIACNTASVTALANLREKSSIPIVGVVPAIKTASNITKNNKIGIMATNRTVSGKYLENLINEFSSDKVVVKVGASEIVTFVERDYYNSSKKSIIEYIKSSIADFIEKEVDSVVLGCTHFIHVAEEIKEALGNSVNVIDSRDGVSNQVIRVIEQNDLECREEADFYLTRELGDCSNYRYFCNKAELLFKGEIRF